MQTNNSIYVVSPQVSAGRSLVTFGLIQMLARKVSRIGYFKPICDTKKKKDCYVEAILSYFKIPLEYNETFCFSRSEIIRKYNDNKISEVYREIIHKYQVLSNRFDFVVVEGLSANEDGDSFETVFNHTLAKTLNLPVCFVIKDVEENEEELLNSVVMHVQEWQRANLKIIGLFINQCTKDANSIREKLRRNLGDDMVISIFPIVSNLYHPTLFEIQQQLRAKPVFNEKAIATTIPHHVVIGAMQIENFISRLSENCLVVMPGDRSDLLFASILANRSAEFPNVVAIVLTGNIPLNPFVEKLLLSCPENTLPILACSFHTSETIHLVYNIIPRIYPENEYKIRLSINVFSEHTDVEKLNELVSIEHSAIITPEMFQHNIVYIAKQHQKHIVLPESDDDRILQAASRIMEDKICSLTLLGKEKVIIDNVKKMGLYWDNTKVEMIDPYTSTYYEDYANTLYELRKHKGLDKTQAKDLMADSSYFATMMVYKGHADGMVSGAKHTTAHTIRPALQFIKTKDNIKNISSIFFMLLKDRVVIYGDCAINPNPNAEQLAEIAYTSTQTALSFGIEPKVALLSYSSGESGKGEDVETVKQAMKILQQMGLPYPIEGPIQYDAAVDKQVAQTKMPHSLVAGQANVLIFPDLNTGNNTYKAVQRESNSLAIGPILQGLRKPINDLSRGALVDDIYNTIVITAIQASSSA